MQALLSSQPNASQLAAALQASHLKDLSKLNIHDSLAASLLQQIQSNNSPKSSSRKPQPHKRAKCDDNSDGGKSDKVKSEIDEEEEYDMNDYEDQANSSSMLDDDNHEYDEHNEDGEETAHRNRNNSTGSPTRSSSSQDQSRSISPSTVFNESTQNNNYSVGSMSDPSAAAALMSSASLPAPANSVASLIASTRKRRTDREAAAERVKKIKPVPDDKKDEAYWERRRKNNEAAKRSRDLRRMKEDEIAVRASFLEQENLKLKAQVTILKAELSKLHFMLYNR